MSNETPRNTPELLPGDGTLTVTFTIDQAAELYATAKTAMFMLQQMGAPDEPALIAALEQIEKARAAFIVDFNTPANDWPEEIQ